MPRAFTPDESDRIRALLKETARESFAHRGLKGTSVEDLARTAGISKGAFYRFYSGKEALLMELMSEIETRIQAQILAAVRADPAHGIELLIDSAVRAVQHNPGVTVLTSPEALQVLRTLPVPEQEELLQRDVRLVAQVMPLLRAAGVGRTVSEKALLGLLRSLVFVGLHREEIGEEFIEAMTSWVTACLRAPLADDSAPRTAPDAEKTMGAENTGNGRDAS